jgi:hypothetical protein
MPRLNAVLMVLLAVAVIGTAGFLCLERRAPAASGPDAVQIQKLLRKLSDSDPDIRREGEAGFRALGPVALAPLAQAAQSPDARLAQSASKLLREIEPARPAAAEAPRPQPLPEPAAQVDPVELLLVGGPSRARAGEPVRFYVRVANHGSAPVLVARHGYSYARFAWIEVTDEKGSVTKFAPEPVPPPELPLEAVALAPGQTRDLYAGVGDGSTGLAALPGRGTFKVRFVYDASEESAYRKVVQASAEGTLLPPFRLSSNALEVALAD